jgi:hypothetical protein
MFIMIEFNEDTDVKIMLFIVIMFNLGLMV